MISFIEGEIVSTDLLSSSVVVVAQQLGFEITLKKELVETVKEKSRLKLFVYPHFRDDGYLFFGFITSDEKQFFKLLLTVSGLGPKMGMSLLNEFSVNELVSAISRKDIATLTRAAGVGKKLAEKLCLELESKIEKWRLLYPVPSPLTASTHSVDSTLKEDLSSALQHLGYHVTHVRTAMDHVFANESPDTIGFEEGLKRLLKELAPRKPLPV